MIEGSRNGENVRLEVECASGQVFMSDNFYSKAFAVVLQSSFSSSSLNFQIWRILLYSLTFKGDQNKIVQQKHWNRLENDFLHITNV